MVFLWCAFGPEPDPFIFYGGSRLHPTRRFTQPNKDLTTLPPPMQQGSSERHNRTDNEMHVLMPYWTRIGRLSEGQVHQLNFYPQTCKMFIHLRKYRAINDNLLQDWVVNDVRKRGRGCRLFLSFSPKQGRKQKQLTSPTASLFLKTKDIFDFYLTIVFFCCCKAHPSH